MATKRSATTDKTFKKVRNIFGEGVPAGPPTLDGAGSGVVIRSKPLFQLSKFIPFEKENITEEEMDQIETWFSTIPKIHTLRILEILQAAKSKIYDEMETALDGCELPAYQSVKTYLTLEEVLAAGYLGGHAGIQELSVTDRTKFISVDRVPTLEEKPDIDPLHLSNAGLITYTQTSPLKNNTGALICHCKDVPKVVPGSKWGSTIRPVRLLCKAGVCRYGFTEPALKETLRTMARYNLNVLPNYFCPTHPESHIMISLNESKDKDKVITIQARCGHYGGAKASVEEKYCSSDSLQLFGPGFNFGSLAYLRVINLFD